MSATDNGNVSLTISESGVATISFYHPAQNSLPADLLDELTGKITQAGQDAGSDVTAVTSQAGQLVSGAAAAVSGTAGSLTGGL